MHVVHKDALLSDTSHSMPLLSEKLSEKLVKGLACEVVTVSMGLDLAIFKEIIYQQNHKPAKIELPVIFFPLRLLNMRKSAILRLQ